MTTTYGKLSYCALNRGFLGCRPRQRRSRRRAPKIAHLKSCISSAARLRPNRLKMRQRRRSSATSPRASAGTDFGRRYLTDITCGARGPAERSSGSSSLMMSRLPRRAAKHVCSLCTQSREDTRASTSLSLSHPADGACSSAALVGLRGNERLLNWFVRGATRVARSAA